MPFSRKLLLAALGAALVGAAGVQAVRPHMSPVPIVSAARLAEIRGDAGALNPVNEPVAADPAAESAAEESEAAADQGLPPIEESSEDAAAEESSEDAAAEDGGSEDAGESTSEGLIVAKEEAGKRLPEADVIGEPPHTTLSSAEVDQVARYVLQGARKSHCEGKGEYCDLKLKSCKDDDCAEDKKEGGASEESSEGAAAESAASEESSAEEESSEERASEESGEAEASGASGSAAGSSESEESSEESGSLEATLSAAEQKALKDLQQ